MILSAALTAVSLIMTISLMKSLFKEESSEERLDALKRFRIRIISLYAASALLIAASAVIKLLS